MLSKLEYVSRSLSRGTHKKFETYVINSIYSKLNNPNLEIATQQYVYTKESRRFINLYFPQLKITIEVDEGYHDNPWQRESDNKRMEAIKLAVLESTILDDVKDIRFLRVPIVENGQMISLEKLNNVIDDIVKIINIEISKYGTLEWIFDKDEIIKTIKARGYLERGDSFSSMVEILSVFGKNVKGWQRCGYKNIWSPTLSVEGSDRGGWVNTISEDLSEIYESGIGGKHSKKPSDVEWDINNNSKRYVFLKYKDALGNSGRRFLGVYVADRYDYDKKAEVWKFIEDKQKLYNI